MTAGSRTFSDSWYRVADLRLGLRPTVTIRKQVFRGEVWYLVHDPFNNSFYRVRPEAYQFVARLHPARTVESVWEECLSRYPDTAPGQEEVIQVLGQLHHNNLLYYRGSTDSTRTFERFEQRRQRELKQKLLNILFPRFTLLDPDRMLDRLLPLIRVATSWFGWLVWFGVVIAGGKTVIDRIEAARNQFEGLLAPSNWFLIYSAIVLVKVLHELGHAVLCKRYGGEVHNIGVSFLLFTPLPYVDASSSWGIRSRYHRALVGAGGMLAELFIAGLAALVWASTGEGVVHALAYNVMWISSVSTIVFNINPLVRLDGYYILSDLLEVPNLFSRASDQLVHLVETWVFGVKGQEGPASSTSEAVFLASFGVASAIYRLLITVGIILFVADKFLILGLIMATITGVTFFCVPLVQLTYYLLGSPKLMRRRRRAIGITLTALITVFALLALIPMPVRFRALGVIEAVHQTEVATEAAGYLKQVIEPTGSIVRAGQPLVELSNRLIEFSMTEAKADLLEVEATMLKAESLSQADLEPLRRRRDLTNVRIAQLENLRNNLIVRAKRDGLWVASTLDEHVGNWMDRGTSLGKVYDPAEFRLTAVVLQEEAHNLFLEQARKVEVRLRGQADKDVPVTSFQMIPYQRRRLPSAVLGWRGGGEIPVDQADQSGLEAVEPFFVIYATLKRTPDIVYAIGRTGQLRFTLDDQPLLIQWYRRARQLIQRRYRT